MNSWVASGGLLALVLACGASCSGSDSSGNGGTTTDAGAAGGGTEDRAGSAGKRDDGANGGVGGDGGSGGAPFVDCTKLSPEACVMTKDCAELTARLLSSPPGAAAQPVGCTPRAGSCEEINITARDPQGREWSFPTTCIPAGWVGEGGAGNN